MPQEGATIDGELYLELLEDWPLLIGRFICAFSSCEYWTYAYLHGLGSAELRNAYANRDLERRVDRIRALAKERALPDPLVQELSDALGELRWLGHLRNLVGHNAPMAHLYHDETTNETKVLMELRGVNNLKAAATKENLVKWFRRARELEERLAFLAGKMAKGAA